MSCLMLWFSRTLGGVGLLGALGATGAQAAEGQPSGSAAGRLVARESAVGARLGVDASILTVEVSGRHAIGLGGLPKPLEMRFELAMPTFVGPSDLRFGSSVSTAIPLGKHWGIVPSLRPFRLVSAANEVHTMRALQSGLGIAGGYLGPRFSALAGVGAEASWATHLEHSAMYRERVYADVQDGWYANTGGNLHIGLDLAVRMGPVDLSLDLGMVR